VIMLPRVLLRVISDLLKNEDIVRSSMLQEDFIKELNSRCVPRILPLHSVFQGTEVREEKSKQ